MEKGPFYPELFKIYFGISIYPVLSEVYFEKSPFYPVLFESLRYILENVLFHPVLFKVYFGSSFYPVLSEVYFTKRYILSSAF